VGLPATESATEFLGLALQRSLVTKEKVALLFAAAANKCLQW
jgi:hypothetical protein